MNFKVMTIIGFLFTALSLIGQESSKKERNYRKFTSGDMNFLEEMTRAVVDSSRIFPGQDLPQSIRLFGPNKTGITLIKPGGRDCYPAFWIRDYAMSIGSGLISPEEQRDIIRLVGETQAIQSRITKNGSLIPAGSIPDHIRINDGLPVYFPGTYDYENQGDKLWRLPPYDDQYYFIHMVWHYVFQTGDHQILEAMIGGVLLADRLEMAFDMVPSDPVNYLVVISDNFQTCDFGFRDIISMTGDVCFGSLLKYTAAKELAELFHIRGEQDKSQEYEQISGSIRKVIPKIFQDEQGFLKASLGRSRQPDVWATAFAVYSGVLDEPYREKACRALAGAYESGTIAMEGQIRHVPTTGDFNSQTAWEVSAARLNTYQNGAYWATPTGWVCYAIYQVNPSSAHQLAVDLIDHLRENDFRKDGSLNGGPYECVYPPSGYRQNPVYMTSVTCPLEAFRKTFLTND